MVINCIRSCKDMKDQGILPDLFIYNDLLRAMAKDGLHMEAEGVMDDMLALGIQPDRQSYHHLMHVRFILPMMQAMHTKSEYSNRQSAP